MDFSTGLGAVLLVAELVDYLYTVPNIEAWKLGLMVSECSSTFMVGNFKWAIGGKCVFCVSVALWNRGYNDSKRQVPDSFGYQPRT